MKLIKYNYKNWLEKNIKLGEGIDELISLYFIESYLTKEDVDKLEINEKISNYIKDYIQNVDKFNENVINQISKRFVIPIRILNISLYYAVIIFGVLLFVSITIISFNIFDEKYLTNPYIILSATLLIVFIYIKYIYGMLLSKYIDKNTILGINKRGVVYYGEKYKYDEIIIPNSMLEFTAKNNMYNNNINFELELKNSSDKLFVDFVDNFQKNSMYTISNALYYYKLKSNNKG